MWEYGLKTFSLGINIFLETQERENVTWEPEAREGARMKAL